MNWTSPAEFFAMGGYAVYVWGSVGACALAIVGELWSLRRRRMAALRAIRRSQHGSHAAPQKECVA